MKFRFGLDRVLRLRSHAESERARALADARREQDARHAEAQRSEQRLREAGEQIAARLGEAVPAGVLQALGLAHDAAATSAAQAREAQDRADHAAEEEQTRFDEARRDRRALERLREHRLEDWTMERARAEQRDLDALPHRTPEPGEAP